ncbi:transposase [Phreatobacter aquaticus]|uniref:Transposase n=1 Tax=Phreatobacter aquaticus TaxID=2570229 RepID=A0A4D7QFF3_9HYPH|nr:transposase [Phreatobacter aquaticus]
MMPANRRRMAPRRAGKAHAKRLVESFNGRFWDECLNDTLFSTLAEVRSAIK